MDAAKLQDKIYAGYAKAAKRIGYVYDVYRPAAAANPLTNKVTSLNASFSAQEWTYTRPSLPDKPFWYCLIDGRLTQLGDYLVRGGQIYFIGGIQDNLPIVAVECNRRIWVTRPPAQTVVGNVGYSGLCAGNDEFVLGSPGGAGGWPCAELFGGRTRSHESLPASGDEHGFRIWLPVSVPIVLASGDIVIDDLGRRFSVGGAERSEQMWRLDLTEVHT
ncbi:conserved hypothetical protein [Cupriavidus necator]|uniref:Uncharacterized protein n=1 Tax=Cupriavidus necator TaxID=106590 RepID=A0A1K0IRJ7_CUPNE|nr:conserved hypothetical protein [Cupriavidus necator]